MLINKGLKDIQYHHFYCIWIFICSFLDAQKQACIPSYDALYFTSKVGFIYNFSWFFWFNDACLDPECDFYACNLRDY